MSNHWHAQHPFLKDEALLSICPAGRGQLVKNLIHVTVKPHCIFGSNLAYLNVSHPINSDNGLISQNCYVNQNSITHFMWPWVLPTHV